MANVGLGLVLALVAGTTALEQFQLRVERVQRQRPPKPEAQNLPGERNGITKLSLQRTPRQVEYESL